MMELFLQPDGEALCACPEQGAAPAVPTPALPGLPRWPLLYPCQL